MEFRRQSEETKKEYYRRIAEVKKQAWVSKHHLQDEEHYKSHFVVQEDDSHDLPKNKKIAKIEYKTEQRLRNRVAAQESRERHRSYVEELEKKVGLYQTLLQKHGALCRNCKKVLGQDNTETESMMGESNCSPEESSKIPVDMASQQALLDSYLDDQMVRIDNQGATSPFSIFFMICLIGVVAIFALQPSNGGIAPRLLTNYHSTLSQLISQQEMPPHENIKEQEELPLLISSSGQSGARQPQTSPTNVSVTGQAESEAGQGKDIVKEWTQYGKYMCSQPEVVMDKRVKSRRGPEFLLLRTGKNVGKSEQKHEEVSEEESQNFQMMPRNWQRLEISSCFLGEL